MLRTALAAALLCMNELTEAFRWPLFRAKFGVVKSPWERASRGRLELEDAVVAKDGLAVADLQVHSDDAAFDWHKQWYAVAALKNTDPTKAHPVQVLGKDLVLWRDKTERWACFDDLWPREAAPLSEGGLSRDNALLCTQSGWRFDGGGNCVGAPDNHSVAKEGGPSNASARVYPTHVAQDIIWVWGENGADAAQESALSPPHLLSVPAGMTMSSSGVRQRDLPYGWDSFMENALDPSHVPVSHHGTFGSAREKAAPMEMSLARPVSGKDGFAIEFTNAISRANSRTEFIPPSLVALSTPIPGGAESKLMMYSTPTRPGWSRLVTYVAFIKPEEPGTEARPKLKLLKLRLYKDREWYSHVTGHKFMAQDLVFLHHQEKTLAGLGFNSSNYGNAVFVPADADRGVMALRKWISKFAGGGPAWDENCNPRLPPRERRRQLLLDVYDNHTKQCTVCMGALKRIRHLLAGAKILSLASLLWAVTAGARTNFAVAQDVTSVFNIATAGAMLPGFLGLCASLWAVQRLEALRKAFYTVHYHAQDNE